MKRSAIVTMVLCLLCCVFLLGTAISSRGSEYKDRSTQSPRTFSQNEIDDPAIWYAVPNTVVTLSSSGNVYANLTTAVNNAAAGQVTHIVIPFHIDTGTITTSRSNMAPKAGATVVLIGDHPTSKDGQVVINDTHSGTSVLRPFRLRGSGAGDAYNGLVLRNIVVQKSSVSSTASQAVYGDPAPPRPLQGQTAASNMGGGFSIENTTQNGVSGGGHLILCRGAIIRNCTVLGNGAAVDMNSGCRLTMMPGSLIEGNRANNADPPHAGGAIYMRNDTSLNMRGGTIQDNIAQGSGGAVALTSVSSRVTMHDGSAMRRNTATGINGEGTVASPRAVGGAIYMSNGSLMVNGGEISENQARLDPHEGTVNSSNAIVTSSGGAVFMNGGTFSMSGNSALRDNTAIRTRSSAVAVTGDSTLRNAYRAGCGGAVYLTGRATFTLRSGFIHDNIASNEGEVINTSTAVNGIHLSNGGGVYMTGTNAKFNMDGGEIYQNTALRTDNCVPTSNTLREIYAGNGGGIQIYSGGNFTMKDGEIYENVATAIGEKPAESRSIGVHLASGGGISIASGSSKVAIDGGIIRNNHARGIAAAKNSYSGNGGGIHSSMGPVIHMTGGEIYQNTATSEGNEETNQGNGAGAYLRHTYFIFSGGKIYDHSVVARHGAGIYASGHTQIEMSKDAQIINNHSANHGGGIAMEELSDLEVQGGSISRNTAKKYGGGVYLSSEESTIDLDSGEITYNQAADGGGLYVPKDIIENVSVGPAFKFDGNVAHNGLKLDNALAKAQERRIRPSKTSLDSLPLTAEIPAGSGMYGKPAVHAFSNYDIFANVRSGSFWRLTYATGKGEGVVTAHIDGTKLAIPSGSLIQRGTKLSFGADSTTQQFTEWTLGTRDREQDEHGVAVDFNFKSAGKSMPLLHTVTANTHVTADFGLPLTNLTISKAVTGAYSDMNTDFSFILSLFEDTEGKIPLSGQFEYSIEGAEAGVSSGGTLVLDKSGQAVFDLRHGQEIIIADVPMNAYFRVVEADNSSFLVSFIDSDNPQTVVDSNATSLLPMSADRTIDFTNEYRVPTSTGINKGDSGSTLAFYALLLLTILWAVNRLRHVMHEPLHEKQRER